METTNSEGLGASQEGEQFYTKELPNKRDWIDNLPYDKIAEGGGNGFSYGSLLMINRDKWNGVWHEDTKTLGLSPIETPTTVPFGNEEFYDSEIADLVDGKVVPKTEQGWKVFKSLIDDDTNRPEYLRAPWPKEEDVPTSEDGIQLIFRGVDYKWMKKFIENSQMSSGQTEFGLPQLDKKGDVFFSSDLGAFNYATVASHYNKPTFGQPSYVIAMKKPSQEEYREVPSEHEVILNRPVKIEEVDHVYEIRPFKMKTGHVWLYKSDSEKVMRLSDGVSDPTFNGPKGEYVYKEIPIDQVRQKFVVNDRRQ